MMRRRRRKTLIHVLRITCMFFAGLFVAGILALSQINISEYRSNIVNALESSTGLPIEINGNLSWKLSLRPKIVVNDVRVKNAPWAKHNYAVYIPRMQVQINPISLLRNQPVIESIIMIKPVFNIEKNEKGELSIATRKKDIVIPQAINDFPFDLNIGIGNVELEKPQIFIIEGDVVKQFMPDRMKISLDNSSANNMDFNGYLLEGNGNYPFLVSFGKFSNSKKVYPIKITVAGDVIPMVVDLTIDSNKKPVDISANGLVNKLTVLGETLGIVFPNVSSAKFGLRAMMENKKITIKKLNVSTKESNLSVTGSYDFSKAHPKIVANIKSDNLDLYDVFPDMREESKSKWVHPNRDLNVFKDVPLFGAMLSMFDAKLDVDMKELRIYRKLYAGNILIKANLENSTGTVVTDLDFANGHIRTKLQAHHIDSGLLKIRAAGIGRGIVVGDILAAVDEFDVISDLPTDFDFYLVGHGHDLSELIKNTNGPIRVTNSSGGYAHKDLMDVLYGKDFITSLREDVRGIFQGKKKNERMKILCAVANMKVRQGKIELDRNVAVQTRAVNIRGVGNVNFGKEKMELALNTIPVDGIKLSISGNVVNSMEFVGNLAEPDLKWKKEEVAEKLATATGVGLAVGALTGGVGLLVGAGVGLVGGDVFGNWTADKTPCRTALKDGAPHGKRGDPVFMNQPVDKMAESFINE